MRKKEDKYDFRAFGLADVYKRQAISKDPYCKVFTYIADLENGIADNDKNWDLLFDARVEDGKIIGSPSDESGIYGVAFRRRTSGCRCV